MINENKTLKDSRPGYEYLIVYMLGKVIQDLTTEFCQVFLKNPNDPKFPNRRQIEQMDQASRSNSQNIAEGYTGESLSTYIMLSGVANGSNEELGRDFEDYLRQRELPIWGKDHPKVRGFREFRVFWIGSKILNTPKLPKDPTEAANLILTLCQMEGYLLHRHIESLKKKHETGGGFKENLFKKRLEYRENKR
jgi:four helix bundle suffix protein